MNKKYITLIVICSALLSKTIFSSEIDQFTDRDLYISTTLDFTEVLNGKTNAFIAEAVENYNGTYDKTSDRELIHKRIAFDIYKLTAGSDDDRIDSEIPDKIDFIYAIIRKSGLGPLQKWIMEEENKDYTIKIHNNLYSGIYPDMVHKNAIISVNGEFIGADKIDHFFDQGYSYWVKSDYGRNDSSAKEFGFDSEIGWYGLKAGGVFSYADLSANWKGYIFYKRLFQGDDPILTVSEEGSIEILRHFDWADYVSSDLDELKNPSLYSKIVKKLLEREIENNKDSVLRTYRAVCDSSVIAPIKKSDRYYMNSNEWIHELANLYDLIEHL